MPNYDEMTLDELDSAIIDLSNKCDALRAEKVSATQVYNRLVGQSSAESLANKLSDEERSALAQILQSQPIDGEETVGTLGENN